MSVTHQNLLDAMNGIAMILDHELRIAHVGSPNWLRFLVDNPPQDPEVLKRSKESVIGRPVTQFIAGETVRATFAQLFSSVLRGVRPALRIDYRCDGPALRRDMRLSLAPILTGAEVHHLLYQSVILSAQPRPEIPLFGAPVADHEAKDILTLCSICARVAWPLGAPAGGREWVEPSEYYRRGGGEVTMISHGFCKDCYTRLQDED